MPIANYSQETGNVIAKPGIRIKWKILLFARPLRSD